jgi:secondary thiamine-phosphate synthase enzyme
MLTLVVQTERRTQLLEITQPVNERLADCAGQAVVIFTPHTTAGLLLQASGPAAAAVAADIEAALERIVDDDGDWLQAAEGDRNPSAHVRAALTASSLTVPLADGRFALGEFLALFLCEFDGPRERTVHLTAI